MKQNIYGTLALSMLMGLSGCIKKSDLKDQPVSAPVVAEIQDQKNMSTPTPLLEPLPMKLCVRPAHRLGVKRCVRNGKWVRLSLASNDVDNDRTDVFTNPRISLKKENFYLDTFRFEDGINHVNNYPDYYHAHAAYGGFAHFVFAMPNRNDVPITYGFAGRDEAYDGRQRILANMNPNIKENVKIQHWNDGRTFKKHAAIYFEVIGDYAETNFRYDCEWMESDQGYDFTQTHTKTQIEIPKIPETFIWRKIAESCESLPNRSQDGRFQYMAFRDLSANPITNDHKFTLSSRNKIKIYNIASPMPQETDDRVNSLNPMNQPGMTTDGSTPIFTNDQKAEISRWESIFDEDLKDISFQPEHARPFTSPNQSTN
ncbi:MAG: hypothetical protein JNL11_13405 [Bdellovibrionaceae bacterium]|nr:hypothetical protein [Pseudobdellovibrionaceae bacterium]